MLIDAKIEEYNEQLKNLKLSRADLVDHLNDTENAMIDGFIERTETFIKVLKEIKQDYWQNNLK